MPDAASWGRFGPLAASPCSAGPWPSGPPPRTANRPPFHRLAPAADTSPAPRWQVPRRPAASPAWRLLRRRREDCRRRCNPGGCPWHPGRRWPAGRKGRSNFGVSRSGSRRIGTESFHCLAVSPIVLGLHLRSVQADRQDSHLVVVLELVVGLLQTGNNGQAALGIASPQVQRDDLSRQRLAAPRFALHVGELKVGQLLADQFVGTRIHQGAMALHAFGHDELEGSGIVDCASQVGSLEIGDDAEPSVAGSPSGPGGTEAWWNSICRKTKVFWSIQYSPAPSSRLNRTR